jgi:hypothetical protein
VARRFAKKNKTQKEQKFMFKPPISTDQKKLISRELIPGSLEYTQAKFLDAARRGDLEKVQDCLGQHIDINTFNLYHLTALHHATSEATHEGHYEVVKLLLRKGANFNIRGGVENDLYTAEEGLNRYSPRHSEIKIKILDLLQTARQAFDFLNHCYLQWKEYQDNLIMEISPKFFSYLECFPEFSVLIYFPPSQSDKKFIEITHDSVEDFDKLFAKQSIFLTRSPTASLQL